MFDVNEILARLKDGDTIDDVATDMASALNEAETKYNEEVKAAAVQKEKEQEAALNDLAETILLSIDEYLAIKCPEVETMFSKEEMSVAEFRKMLDELTDTIMSLTKFVDSFDLPQPGSKSSKAEGKVDKKPMSADDIIADFLNRMRW